MPTIPFSLLPARLFEQERWLPVQAGRWRASDHVNLEELRASVRLCEQLSATPPRRNHIYYSLEDNSTTSGAVAKGRSSSWPVNFFLREKASACLVGEISLLLPWVQTDIMPADGLSRAM